MSALRSRVLLLLVLSLGACQRGHDDSGLRGVILILLDTVRADHVSCYGYERPTTPHLDALAAEGVRFEQVVASAPWTLPSTAGILAGQYSERVFDRKLEASLVETLQRAGIETVAFTEGGFVSKFFGMDRGFDRWTEEEGEVQLLQPGQKHNPNATGGIEHTFARAEQWLQAHGDGRFFLLVHTYEAHTPYTNHDFTEGLDPGRVGPVFTLGHVAALEAQQIMLTESEVEYVRALYDGDIANADRYVGRLLDELDKLGLSKKVAVVVTSDHGEDLGTRFPSHMFDHGHSLLDEMMMVPLILRDPSHPISGKVIHDQVRSIDVMPTIVDLLGVHPQTSLDGKSLLGYITGDETGERLALLGQTKAGPLRAGLRSMGYKYIRVIDPDAETPLSPPPMPRQLYDLASDPSETHNLVTERPQMADTFEQMLLEKHPGRNRAISPDLANEADPALIERLRSLGYLH